MRTHALALGRHLVKQEAERRQILLLRSHERIVRAGCIARTRRSANLAAQHEGFRTS
jgi:hypothetical protein